MAQNNAQEERHPDQRRDDAHRNDHPGHQIFRRHRGHRQHQRANQRAGRQIETVIFAEDHACDVRRHQADKADRPDEGHRQRRENADAQQRGQPQTAHVDAEAHGPVFTQTQRGQFPRAHHRQRQQHGEYAEQDAQLVPRGARQAAHGQNTSPCSVSSLAMNCIIDTSALKVNTSAMPNSTTPEVATRVQRVMPSSISAANSAKIKALAEMNH